MKNLSLVMKLQAVVFAAYALAFVLLPDFTLDTVFGWSGVDLFWPRGVGVAFVGLAWLAYNVATNIESRVDLVWPLWAVPALYVVVFVWMRAADSYQGTDAFWWTSIVVTGAFTLAIGWFRMAAERSAV